MLILFMLSVFLPFHLAVDLNFDPGLTIRKAAYWNPYTPPHNAYYFENCMDSTGKWKAEFLNMLQ